MKSRYNIMLSKAYYEKLKWLSKKKEVPKSYIVRLGIDRLYKELRRKDDGK